MQELLKRNIGRQIFKRRSVVLIFSILFFIVAVTGATFAWFISSDSRINQIGIKQYMFDVKLDEDFNIPTEENPAKKGDTVKKEIRAENSGDIASFVRVMVFPMLIASDGTTILEAQFGKQLDFAGLNDTDWKYGGDGYFYYINILNPGEFTAELFKGVKLNQSVGGVYKNTKLIITLAAESVEIKNGQYREAWWGGADVSSLSPELQSIDNKLKDLA